MPQRHALVLCLAAMLSPLGIGAQSEPEPDVYRYTYDAADNLVAITTEVEGDESTRPLPIESTGRNRPAVLGELPLAWDANGNLVRRGDLHLAYDFRNRLTEVRGADGEVLASYVYDTRSPAT